MLRIAICDDLKSERDMVKGFLRSFFAAVPYEYTLAEYSRGETMVDDYDDGSVDFDLIFMDIFMDGMLGMEAARCLRRYAPHVSIVFLTTTPAYALESYDVYAYGYLVNCSDVFCRRNTRETRKHFCSKRDAGAAGLPTGRLNT